MLRYLFPLILSLLPLFTYAAIPAIECAEPAAMPTRLFVNKTADAGGDGASWATAFRFLQDALTAARANSVDEIWIAAGTYYPDEGTGVTDNDRLATFSPINDVDWYGGFTGLENPATFNLANRDLQTNETILSGDIDQDDVGDFGENAGNSHVVVNITAELPQPTRVDGFTVERGNNAGNSTSGFFGSGGVNLRRGNPDVNLTISNCKLWLNTSSSGGGLGINTFRGLTNCTLNNCLITDNRAILNNSNSDGGAISISGNIRLLVTFVHLFQQ